MIDFDTAASTWIPSPHRRLLWPWLLTLDLQNLIMLSVEATLAQAVHGTYHGDNIWLEELKNERTTERTDGRRVRKHIAFGDDVGWRSHNYVELTCTKKQCVALTGRNTTGPPRAASWWVTLYIRRVTDDRRRQTLPIVTRLLSPLCTSITPSLFHSRLKTYLFHKSYPRSFSSLLPPGLPLLTFPWTV